MALETLIMALALSAIRLHTVLCNSVQKGLSPLLHSGLVRLDVKGPALQHLFAGHAADHQDHLLQAAGEEPVCKELSALAGQAHIHCLPRVITAGQFLSL